MIGRQKFSSGTDSTFSESLLVLESDTISRRDIWQTQLMIGSNITQVYYAFDKEMNLLRNNFGSEVGSLQRNIDQVSQSVSSAKNQCETAINALRAEISSIRTISSQSNGQVAAEFVQKLSNLDENLRNLENSFEEQVVSDWKELEKRFESLKESDSVLSRQLADKFSKLGRDLEKVTAEQAETWVNYLKTVSK